MKIFISHLYYENGKPRYQVDKFNNVESFEYVCQYEIGNGLWLEVIQYNGHRQMIQFNPLWDSFSVRGGKQK